MLYSLRMRAAQGGAHEAGGRHISGAERIVSYEKVETVTNEMLQRAFTHTRGQADFINVIVEKIEEEAVTYAPLLSVDAVMCSDVTASHVAAQSSLIEAGVSFLAAQCGITALVNLRESMGGAILLCAVTGRRLDKAGEKGVRVSRIDIENEEEYIGMLGNQGLHNMHVREALVLASKVAAAPGMVAELCWSDDPEYTTGYVASTKGYTRIPYCKALGSSIGGRVFFVKPDVNLEMLQHYLKHQPVLVRLSKKL